MAVFASYFVTAFFTSLSVTPLLYMQPLNRIIGIISKNGTTLLSVNILEVIVTESFIVTVTESVTETVTVSNYLRHMNTGCCYIIA